MAGSSRRRFSKEFKLDAARLVTERGYSVSKAASELGISGWSLRGWIKDLQTSGELKVNDKTESVADELKCERRSKSVARGGQILQRSFEQVLDLAGG